MKQAFLFQDEKSNKFWTIEYAGNELCVHYGKTDTIGKYEIKEFDDETTCEKEAKKLIASKLKKGYQENLNFDFEGCIYIDTDEMGLNPKTSHPRFAEHFIEDFYYDCGDEEAPFGSDEGSDTLHEIQEQLRKNANMDFAAFPKKLIETIWDMEYIPVETLDQDAVLELAKTKEMDIQQSDMVTYATAFGQIKTTGKLDAGLKERALLSLQRYAVIYNEEFEYKLTPIQQQMYDDLQSFSI